MNAASNSAGGGVTIGVVIAALCSWSVNHSVLWAFVHGALSWIYVTYYFLTT